MLIFSKASMFLWAEAVATSCYTKNRSLIHTRYNKPPYELVHPKNPGLTFFRVFGELYYPTNDSEDFGKLQPIADIGIFVGYAPSWKGPGPAFLTPRQISSGLVPNPVPAAPYVPPTNKDLEILFLPMFEEYLETPCVERPGFPALAVPVPVNTVGTPSSTTIDQDAPCPSHSPSSLAFQSPSLLQGVAAESTIMEVNPFTPVDNDPFVNVFAPKPSSEASSSGDQKHDHLPDGCQHDICEWRIEGRSLHADHASCQDTRRSTSRSAQFLGDKLVSWSLKKQKSVAILCMRTCSSSNLHVVSPSNPSTSNPKRRNRRRSKQLFIFEESLVNTMANQRTMEELLRAPTEGYAEAIVIPLVLAEQFELKHSLINMMTSDQFFGLEKDNPHDHIRWGSPPVARKRTPAFYLTWEDFVSKFINEFFPPSRTTNLRNEISNFQ
nr:hypothetical protein [Tanacetum cinerariifolium]